MRGYCAKVLTKKFTSSESKKCYMKVVKWLSLNVVGNPKLDGKVTYTITKSYNNGIYTYTLELFARIDGEQVKERHCAICKEVHNSFFVNQQSDCSNCKLFAYFRREDDMLSNQQQAIKQQLIEGGEQ